VTASRQSSGGEISPIASVLAVGGAMMEGPRFAETTVAPLQEHYQNCHTIALVLHATHPDERDAMESLVASAFRAIGEYEAYSVHRFSAREAKQRLQSVDGIFVGGGETFGLLRELHETGQLELIRARVLADMPYGCSSAGANVTGQVIGTTNDFPVTDIPTRRALGVLPLVINPHHPRADETEACEVRAAKIRSYLRWNPQERVLALGDRAMVRLHGGELRVKRGPVWDYTREGRVGVPEGAVLRGP
jgi:dipeptidase E